MRASRVVHRFVVVAAVGVATTLLAATAPAVAAEPPGPGTPGTNRPVRGPSGPAEYEYQQKSVQGTVIPRHAYDIAAAEASRLPTTGRRWQPLGPTNIGGRIVGLALDPQQPDTLYAAAASGGLWRSRDAGDTFEPAWPDDLTQAMGAVAAAPDGTLFAGTGEPQPGGGSVTYGGTGMYRSTDRGATWQAVGLRDSGAIGAIAVDPADPNRVLVAATGSLYSPGGDRGVYLSRDGGDSWARTLDVPNEFTGAVDVQLDPTDPQRVYAVLWDKRRTPDQRTYGGVGSGVYRSVDGGLTWTRLGGGLPAAAPEIGRIGLGIAASEPGRLYAIVNDERIEDGQSFAGFYTSGDGGDTWTRLPDTPEIATSQSSFGWWFGKVWVDPDDARHLHVAGVPLLTSADGGLTWTADDETIHVDHHALIWDPRYESRAYLGNDGGVYRSDANGDGGWVKATYEPYTQFYSAAITPQDVSRVSGGTQDNGSLRSWNGPAFNEYVGGDGEENIINPLDRDNVFACFQYGNCFRSVDGGDTSTLVSPGPDTEERNWFTPVQFDPNDPNVVYYGANRLYRSTDNGVTFAPISPDLTDGQSQDNYPFGTITTVAAAPADPRTIYVGTDDGRVWITRDLGANWQAVYSGDQWVTRVAVDADDPAVAYVTLSGYRSGSPLPHVMRTTNGGQSWTDLSANLPQAPVNDVVVTERDELFVATDQGVFVRRGGEDRGRWQRLGRGLPLVPITDIEYDDSRRRLVAASFGRGLFETRA